MQRVELRRFVAIHESKMDCFVAFANAHAPRNDNSFGFFASLRMTILQTNSSICGVAFVFVENFGIKLD